ncbi:MAG: hypothetical protein ABR569_03055 [Gaiellaceae bacterium]
MQAQRGIMRQLTELGYRVVEQSAELLAHTEEVETVAQTSRRPPSGDDSTRWYWQAT